MNIGIFTDTYYPEINGVANSSYELKKGLEKMGHKVYVFTVTNPNAEELEEDVFRMPSIPFIFLKCTIPNRVILLSISFPFLMFTVCLLQIHLHSILQLSLFVFHSQIF